MEEELNKKRVRKDLEDWARSLRTIMKQIHDIEMEVRVLYNKLNEVYKGVGE